MITRQPSNLMRKAAARLFPGDPGEAERFLRALLQPRDPAPCLLWTGSADGREDFASGSEPAAPDEAGRMELPDFVVRLAPGAAPGRHPLHAAGAFYCLDFSSVWAASALLPPAGAGAAPGAPGSRVLDLCAAPGGKSIFASLALRPSLLLANEFVPKRLGTLRHNLARCRIPSAFTARLAPREIAALVPGAFGVVIVDAPCSGQSLLAKGVANPGAFHPAAVSGNAKRQAGILAAAADCVAPGGRLLYSTCTFAERENERVIARLLQRRSDFRPVPAGRLERWRSPLAAFPAYRLYPQSGLGAGAFACLLEREGDATEPELSPGELAAILGAREISGGSGGGPGSEVG